MKGNRKMLVIGTALALVVVAGVASAAHAGQCGHRLHAGMMLKMADANGDGVASVDEAKALVAQHAAAMDADKNGTISAAEVDAFHAQMRAERRAARFAKLDADKNGSVSVAEFTAAQNERIGRWDHNKDGVLDSKDRPQREHAGQHGDHHAAD